MDDNKLLEESLIAYAKPYLKAKGFRKKNKRWTKISGDFTLVFYIQGSCFSKEDYYVRPGIFMNALCPAPLGYGHIMTEISITTPEQILSDAERFFAARTDKRYFKQKMFDFIEWEKRNPLEKRRAGTVDCKTDPVPAKELFTVNDDVRQYVLSHF